MENNNVNKALKEEARQAPYLKRHIITKQLKLDNVIEGGYSDDVLVRSWDNTVKYVSQYDLTSRYQDLQSVINTGSSASNQLGQAEFLTDYGNGPFFRFISQDGNGLSNVLYIDKVGSQISSEHQYTGENARFVASEGKINMFQGTSNGSYFSTKVEFNDPIGITTLKFPAKPSGEYTLATTDDFSVSGSFVSNINANSTNVKNPGNTFIDKIYYTKTGKHVSCSASISIETNKDTSNEIAFIQIEMPFPQSTTSSRLNAGNGVLLGGPGLGYFFAPATIQLEGTNNAKILFVGKPGDNGSFYQGEIHWTYETD